MVQKITNSPWQRVVLGTFIGSLVVGFIALAFLWPAKTAEPNSVPIAFTGSDAPEVAAVKKNIEANAGDKIELITVANRGEAVEKMKNREVYGAIILTLPQPEVLSASANGPALNAVPTGIASSLQAGLNQMAARAPAGTPVPQVTLKTIDVIPAHDAKFDIAQMALPLVFGGMIGGILVVALIQGRWQRLAGLAMYSLFAANILFLILGNWFNVLPADYWAVTGALSLSLFATSSFIVGSYVLAGKVGLASAAAFTMLVANPISGLALPALFLPEPWGAIGQSLTVGASGTLLRAAVYFPVAAVLTAPIVVLGIWSVLGTLATISRDRGALKG